MDKMYYAKKYVEIFPEYTHELEKYLSSYGELLGHVFFGDLINPHLVELLKHEVDIDRIEKIFGFINDMYLNGEDDIKNVVVVTILEYLGDDPLILKQAFRYLNEELKQESYDIEKQIGRDPFGKWNI
jgi:hypothetical protein